jgi:hypothetical protein
MACPNHYGRTPMLDGGPFQQWLRRLISHGKTVTDLAAAMGVHERRVRAWLVQDRISEAVVERAGLAYYEDPRLAAELYPELDF